MDSRLNMVCELLRVWNVASLLDGSKPTSGLERVPAHCRPLGRVQPAADLCLGPPEQTGLPLRGSPPSPRKTKNKRSLCSKPSFFALRCNCTNGQCPPTSSRRELPVPHTERTVLRYKPTAALLSSPVGLARQVNVTRCYQKGATLRLTGFSLAPPRSPAGLWQPSIQPVPGQRGSVALRTWQYVCAICTF